MTTDERCLVGFWALPLIAILAYEAVRFRRNIRERLADLWFRTVLLAKAVLMALGVGGPDRDGKGEVR